jgi:hypothetical protein
MQQQKSSLESKGPKGPRRGNEERKADATEAIEAKVLELEAIAQRQKPLVSGLPTSMRQFRAWTDPALGLVRIGSSGTTDVNESPHNGKLIGRAYDAMKAIARLQTTRKLRVYVPREKRIEELKNEVKELTELNRRLASEVLEFMNKYDVERKERNRAEMDRDVARGDLQALRLEYLKVTRNRPRGVT